MPRGLTRRRPAFVDARGAITDVVADEKIEHVALITSRRGAVRGNHYHARSTQYVFVVCGRLRYTAQLPGGRARSFVVAAGDLVVSPPRERHAMRALEDTTFLALSRGVRGGAHFEDDTFRLAPGELLDEEAPTTRAPRDARAPRGKRSGSAQRPSPRRT